MTRVILIRPGMTDFDEQGRIKGTLDIPLNAYGADQIERTADELADLGIEVVYTAPCRAAEQTGAVLSRSLGVKTREVRNLHNLDPGLWQGRLIDEVRITQRKVYRQWQEQPDTVCPPEGEMLCEARAARAAGAGQNPAAPSQWRRSAGGSGAAGQPGAVSVGPECVGRFVACRNVLWRLGSDRSATPAVVCLNWLRARGQPLLPGFPVSDDNRGHRLAGTAGPRGWDPRESSMCGVPRPTVGRPGDVGQSPMAAFRHPIRCVLGLRSCLLP